MEDSLPAIFEASEGARDEMFMRSRGTAGELFTGEKSERYRLRSKLRYYSHGNM
jgi:hypothetical protein